MNKTTTIFAMLAGLTVGSALPARAQPPATSGDPAMFVSISGGGQFQSRTFTPTNTFTLYNEAGTVTSNQTIGGGFVFDATVGYRVWRRLSAAVGVSTFNGTGEAAAAALVPNPLFFGHPTAKNFTATDLGQTAIAVNFQAVWTQRVTEKIDVLIFGGPSLINVNQDIPSITETADASPTTVSESKTTGKAGTAGVDISYRMNDRYSVGGFVRYLGGTVDLPSISGLSVGGTQAGGGIRVRF